MRLFLSLMIFFISFSSISQDLSKDLYGFKKSYNLKSLSQVEIHSLIQEWIGQNFESPKDVTKYDDENKIIVERSFKMSSKHNFKL